MQEAVAERKNASTWAAKLHVASVEEVRGTIAALTADERQQLKAACASVVQIDSKLWAANQISQGPMLWAQSRLPDSQSRLLVNSEFRLSAQSQHHPAPCLPRIEQLSDTPNLLDLIRALADLDERVSGIGSQVKELKALEDKRSNKTDLHEGRFNAFGEQVGLMDEKMKNMESYDAVLNRNIEVLERRLNTELKQMVEQHNKTTPSGFQADVGARVAGLEKQLGTMLTTVKSSEERLVSTTAALLERLAEVEASVPSSEKTSNKRDGLESSLDAEVHILRGALRQDKQASNALAAGNLESMMQTVSNLSQEVHNLRGALGQSKQASNAQATVDLEPLMQIVSNLSQDLDMVAKLQEQCKGGLTALESRVSSLQKNSGSVSEAQRRLLELEMHVSAQQPMPWAQASPVPGGLDHCLSCGTRTRQRSVSPTASRSWSQDLRGGGLGDPRKQSPCPLSQHVGCSWRNQPQTPRSARPISGFRRAAESQVSARMEETMATLFSAPAGPGISAARFQRSPGSAAEEMSVPTEAPASYRPNRTLPTGMGL